MSNMDPNIIAEAGESLTVRDPLGFGAIFGADEGLQGLSAKSVRSHLAIIYDALRDKPALTVACAEANRVRSAVLFVVAAFNHQKRDNSPELTREHSMRNGDDTSDVLRNAQVSADIIKRAVQKGLLHDTIEDCGVQQQQIDTLYGKDVGDGVFRLSVPDNSKAVTEICKMAGKDALTLGKDELRVVLKMRQAHLLMPDELVVKALDNIDKPRSDAKDFAAGNIALGGTVFSNAQTLITKTEQRQRYHEVYVRRLQEPASIAFFGQKSAAKIVEQLNQRFADATASLMVNAGVTSADTPDTARRTMAGILALGFMAQLKRQQP